ncbi:MAG: hypothetical protein R6X20_10985 [Phycisphaerae bacterium]
MTKPSKKDVERFYTDKALAHLDLRPVSVSSVKNDPPDVRVEFVDKVIGVEVTDYHRDLTDNSSALRRQEARIDEIGMAFDQVRQRFPEVKADGRVFFRKGGRGVGGVSPDRLVLMPGRSDVEAFVTELFTYVQSHADEITASRQVFDTFTHDFPLLKRYAEELEVRRYSWTPIWNFDPRAKTHGFAGAQWVQHVRRKAERIRQQQSKHPERLNRYHEIWLLLTAGPRSSQSVAATLDHFAGDNELLEELEASPFDAVFVYQCWEGMPLYKWRRRDGWVEVPAP